MENRAEFYDTAVRMGFYGIERSGLHGKKDNARKYWEDISIKVSLRPILERMLERKYPLSVVDLGCGSGEGFELLTHIPLKDHVASPGNDYLLTSAQIQEYIGFDISESMIVQGRKNYTGCENIAFERCDLSRGLPRTRSGKYDLFFSSYASLSHLSHDELFTLTKQIMANIEQNGCVVFDLLGRYSPEWPVYWGGTAEKKLPYNMAYLYREEERGMHDIETFQCAFWSPAELARLIERAAKECNRKAAIHMRDRSIFIGRHMDTGIFNNCRKNYRYQVNRLFDRDFRGVLGDLEVELDFAHPYVQTLPGQVLERLEHYIKQWNYIVGFVESMSASNSTLIHNIFTNIDDSLKDDLDMLAWLFRNASRFPVTDFWASVMGPQLACVLRNCEMNYSSAVGCGHGLFCMAEVE